MILLTNRFTTGLIDITEPTKHDKRVQKLMVLDRMITNNRSGFVDIALFNPNGVLLTISSDSEPYKFLYKNPNPLLQNSPLFINNFPFYVQNSPFFYRIPRYLYRIPSYLYKIPCYFKLKAISFGFFPSVIYSQTCRTRPPKMLSQDGRLWEMIAYKS